MKDPNSKHAEFLERGRSIPEIAKYTGTSIRFVYAEIGRGNLPEPTRYSSGVVRFFAEDLREWLNGLGDSSPRRPTPNTPESRERRRKKKKEEALVLVTEGAK
jgi:predicted DNA-binding transcriptional regulator AlpA